MPGAGLSDQVVDFIARHIKSLEHLEVLLLLSSNSEKTWTPRSVYEVIKSSEASVQERLRELSQQGLLIEISEGEATYRFQPVKPSLKQLVADLSLAYKERRIRVVETIYSAPTERVQSFADAFRLRKDK